MSSLILKIIAVVTMAIDHVGFLFFPEEVIFRIIGRISFPLFAFLIAEGFQKTKNVNAYLKRLSIFAVISQIPFFFFEKSAGITDLNLNILFTLALGVIALMISVRIKNWPIKIFNIAIILAVAYLGKFSYGIYGILSIIGSYIFLQNKKAGLIGLSILPFLENVRLFLSNIFFLQFFAIFSLVPIYFYNGKQGPKISRWWFYWFYPAHLAVLVLIFLIIK
ncbi:MAG: TraX family protein [Candidatus Paceibacterota bacterium]